MIMSMELHRLRIAVTLATAWLASVQAATITVDVSRKLQVIEGIGGMAAMEAWFNDGPYYTDAWLDLVVDELGLSMFRTELYPRPQDSWGERGIEKQIPFWRALMAKAQRSGVTVRAIASVWSPPANMKTNGDTRSGTFIMSMIPQYADYLVDYCRYWKEQCGFDLYALSVQNEPQIAPFYNSCSYYPTQMGDVIIGVATKFAQNRVPVKIHFSDDIFNWYGWNEECAARVRTNRVADSVASVLSVHYGGADSTSSQCYKQYANGARSAGKTAWNTEFGNGHDSWDGAAWENARAMYLMFKVGFSAIVYWLLGPHSDPSQLEESVMADPMRPGPKARVLQAYARVIRPGARMVGATSSDPGVLALAFVHEEHRTTTVIAVNMGGSTTLTVQGSGLPSSWDVRQTSPSQNFAFLGTKSPGDAVTLTPKSITSFYNQPSVSVGRADIPKATASGTSSALRGLSLFGLDGRRVSAAAGTARGAYCAVAIDSKGGCVRRGTLIVQ